MPITVSRRQAMQALPAFVGLASAAQAAQPMPVRLLLNTSYSGPQAWILLAEDLGYFRREGLQVEIAPGAGAYTAAPRVAGGGFHFGYGDIHSLIEVAAREPERAPVAVFAAFNASPSTVVVEDSSSKGPLSMTMG